MQDTTDQSKYILVRLDREALCCELTIEPPLVVDSHTESLCQMALTEHGVLVTAEIRRQLLDLLSTYSQSSDKPAHLEILGAPAVDGQPGRFEWSEECCPTIRQQASHQADGTVDHYNRSKLVCVESGCVIGRILDPTDGLDGVNLRGELVAAKPGKSATIDHDDTILRQSNGELTAQVSGAIQIHGTRLHIAEELEIRGDIDFKVGHLNFNGSVRVDGGVLDNFRVHVKGNLTIGGVIDAAMITVGGDLTVRTGISGKERAVITVGRHLRSRYISQAKVRAGRGLTADRELLNCDTQVGGPLEILGGGIVGGVVHAMSQVRTQSIGSAAGVITNIHLASSPHYERKIALASAKRADLERKIAGITRAIEKLQTQVSPLTSSQKEEQTESMYTVMELQANIAKLDDIIQRLVTSYQQLRQVDFRVERVLFAGVRLHCGELTAIFNVGLKGPLHISLDAQGELVIRERDGAPRPLSSVAKIELPAQNAA